ncbi:hypothetical protein G5I_09545 [Acromyrmex echinatior]|uniref:Uncharacterized protein n=1 Tax=Acromyrmex echinatior TaxID=103372 RepID=F4WUH5_ACREC|nr:hypothetical protein G5I_09545 [Acromyrmex echinatior]
MLFLFQACVRGDSDGGGFSDVRAGFDKSVQPWNLALTRPRCLKYSERVVALVAAFDAAANGRSRTQTLVVEGDVLVIDWQPWPRSRQGSGMQIHGRDCGLRRRPASIVTTVVSHQ